MPSVEDLELRLPHRRPWLLVDRVLEVGEDRVVAEKRVTAGDPLARAGLSGPLLVEALAQTAACLMGRKRSEHRGYLVALKDFRFDGQARPGDTVRLITVQQARFGALH